MSLQFTVLEQTCSFDFCFASEQSVMSIVTCFANRIRKIVSFEPGEEMRKMYLAKDAYASCLAHHGVCGSAVEHQSAESAGLSLDSS